MTGEAKPLKEDFLLITFSERRGHGTPHRATGGSTKFGQKVKEREKAWLRTFMAFFLRAEGKQRRAGETS